jgi:hypothetical protein
MQDTVWQMNRILNTSRGNAFRDGLAFTTETHGLPKIGDGLSRKFFHLRATGMFIEDRGSELRGYQGA